MAGQDAAHDYGSDIYTEAEGDDDTLANLGPLRPLAGIWTSASGADVHPIGPGSDITGTGGRRRRAQPVHRAVRARSRSTRRPTGRSCSTACATTRTSSSPGEVETFHDQVGYWLWEPAAGTVLHTLAIPRGQVVLAAGPADARRHRVRGDRRARLRGLRHPVEPVPRPGLPHVSFAHARHRARRRHVVLRGAHGDGGARPQPTWSTTSTATRLRRIGDSKPNPLAAQP